MSHLAWVARRLAVGTRTAYGHGLGLPVGLAMLIPLVMLGLLYVYRRRTADLGGLFGAFAAGWAAFEAWRWLNAASDPAVSIPGWTPFPLAAAVALLIVAVAVVIAASPQRG